MKKGVLLLGHGSRRREANAGLEELASLVQAGLGMRVLPAFFQFSQPSLEDTVARFVDEGVSDIIIVPAFLFPGVHLESDVPEALEKLQEQYGERVRFVLTPSIGPDPRLAEIFIERVRSVDGAAGKGSGTGCACCEGREITNPEEITARSRNIIEERLGEEFFLRKFPGPEGEVVRRVVHAMGNPDVAGLMRFHSEAVETGIAALRRGTLILTDVEMVKTGINRLILEELGSRVECFIHHPEVRARAQKEGLTRAIVAVRHFRELLPGSIVVIGNAPTALAEVLRQSACGFKPALIVGTPVGFVGAAEAKERLAAQDDVPYITLLGNQGGSTAAVAVVNALLALAQGQAGL